MNVTIPEKEKVNKKAVVLYTISILVCVIAAVAVATAKYYGSDELDKLIVVNASKVTQEDAEEEKLKAEFDSIFTNSFEGETRRKCLKNR